MRDAATPTDEPMISAEIMAALLQTWRHSGESRALPVAGVSMWPVLRAGDTIHVSPITSGIRRGQIIVFQAPNGLIVHRVVGQTIRAGTPHPVLIAKGDNRRDRDKPVTPERLLGVVTQRDRGSHSKRLDTAGSRWAGLLLWRHAWLVSTARRVLARLRPRFGR